MDAVWCTRTALALRARRACIVNSVLRDDTIFLSSIAYHEAALERDPQYDTIFRVGMPDRASTVGTDAPA